MRIIRKLWKYSLLYFVNHFLSGTHFYKTKRFLLNLIDGVFLEKGVSIVGPLSFYGKMTVGKDTFIGRNFNVEGNGDVIIGRNCDIAPHVCIITGSHQIGNMERRAGKGFSGKVEIGNGCWICAKTCVLPNVIIEDGVVVAACSLVNKRIGCNCVVGGIPATIIRTLD